MSAFLSLNTADQQDISNRTSNAIRNALNGNIGMANMNGGQNTRAANQLIDNFGFDFASNPDKTKSIRSNMQFPAQNLISSMAGGYLTSDNLPDFESYDMNSALKNSNTPEGTIADSMNGIMDGAANLKTATKTDATSQQNIKGKIGTLTSNAYYTSVFDTFYPKTRYTFLVQIVLVPEYQKISTDFTFLINKFDKPTFEIEYEEVNFYNFRSQVPKRSIMHPVNFTMHNDIQNKSMNFIVSYMRRISPIFNQSNMNEYEARGMDFAMSTGSYGLITKPQDETSELSTRIISHITIYEVFNHSQTMDVYTYYRPQIKSVKFADYDMSASEPSDITVEFVYDNASIDTGVEVKLPESVSGVLQLGAGTPVKLSDETSAPNQDLLDRYVHLQKTPTKDPAEDPQQTDPSQVPDGQTDSNNPLSPGDIAGQNPEEAINQNNVAGNGPVDTSGEDFRKSIISKEQAFVNPNNVKDNIQKDSQSGTLKIPPAEAKNAVNSIDRLTQGVPSPFLEDQINNAIGSPTIANKYFNKNPNNQSNLTPK
jgi:hypothetical protein